MQQVEIFKAASRIDDVSERTVINDVGVRPGVFNRTLSLRNWLGIVLYGTIAARNHKKGGKMILLHIMLLLLYTFI